MPSLLKTTTAEKIGLDIGQSQSRAEEEEEEEEEEEAYLERREEWLKPIETREQLVIRYRSVLKSAYASFKQQSWLEQLFENFASEPGYWSEPDFIYVLSLSFPEPSNRLLLEAGSLLYRLGSYPYHQEESAEYLDLSTAITVLLRYDENLLRESNNGEEGVDHATRLQGRYLRILFQSLAPTPNPDVKERGEGDDEDVIEALHVVSRRRILRHPTNPKIGTSAAALPPPSSFPPSYSRSLEGRLANTDLQVLIRLVLACQLHWSGTGPEHIVASPSDGFNKAASCILSTFDLDEDGRCGWQSFHRVMAQQNSGPHIAMPRILNSLTKRPPTINEDALFSLPPARAAELLRSAYASTEPSLPTPGAILTLPLLCQLSMFLPEDLPLDKAKLVYSSRSNRNTIQTPKTHFESPSASSLLLLVSGKSHHRHSTTKHIICGAYRLAETPIPSATAHRPLVFQCAPHHRVWSGVIDRNARRNGPPPDEPVPAADELALRLLSDEAKPGPHQCVELRVDYRLGEGGLTGAVDDGEVDVGEFRIEELEVLDVTAV